MAWTLDPEWGVAWTLDPEWGVAWTLDLVDSTRALTLSAARLRFFLPRFAARAHHPPLPLLSPSSIENNDDDDDNSTLALLSFLLASLGFSFKVPL